MELLLAFPAMQVTIKRSQHDSKECLSWTHRASLHGSCSVEGMVQRHAC